MVKAKMSQQRKVGRHGSRQSSAAAETASVGSTRSTKSNGSNDFHSSSSFGQTGVIKRGALSKHGSQESADSGTGSQPTSILNVAEMLLHGVADSEILDIWLRSIHCEEFVSSFVENGYDMPTISRITPADLAAIGVTEPAKRLKILTEIKKLNLQDGIPNFRPTSLSQWLSLIRLDGHYYKSLCDQQINSIEKLCQLTWEDFEELGISKLGHQKRFQLAIERLRELDADATSSAKTMSEPIYDTNPSQILLVASTENHSMNGPIINKQSSTSELSSTGSGSMHSVYSSASTQYQPAYLTPPSADNHQSTGNSNGLCQQQQQQQQQPIYSQVPQQIYQQPSQMHQHQQQSHYQSVQQLQHTQHHHFAGVSSAANNNNLDCRLGSTLSHQSRQSLMCQLPFSALANLPKHQQQQLQQSSIYATLSRQPPKMKQPPPPVPIRTNSLKTSSMTDKQQQQLQQQHHQQQQQQQQSQQDSYQQVADMNGTLLRSGKRVSGRTQFSSQTMLTKNKSFSGNAHMEASRARFLNRNSQQPLRQFSQQQIQTTSTLEQNGSSNCNNGNQNFIYATQPQINGFLNSRTLSEEETFRQQQQQQLTHNSYNQNLPLPGLPVDGLSPLRNSGVMFHSGAELDLHSDSNSIKSLLVAPTCSLSSADNPPSSSTQDSGSSQTLYNSASSGGSSTHTDRHSLNTFNLAHQSGATASSCTLADANNLALDQRQQPPVRSQATTGRDDDFPPPPSPLSLSDSDEQEVGSLGPDGAAVGNNFTELTHSMLTFRVT